MNYVGPCQGKKCLDTCFFSLLVFISHRVTDFKKGIYGIIKIGKSWPKELLSVFSLSQEWTDCDTGTYPIFLVICAHGVDFIAESEMYLTFMWKGGTFLATLVIWPQLSRQFRALEL